VKSMLGLRVKRLMSTAKSTVVGVDRIVVGSYKIYFEVRKGRTGFNLSISIENGKRVSQEIEKTLRKHNYEFESHIDSYGKERINVRNLSLDDLIFIRKLVKEAINVKLKREDNIVVFA